MEDENISSDERLSQVMVAAMLNSISAEKLIHDLNGEMIATVNGERKDDDATRAKRDIVVPMATGYCAALSNIMNVLAGKVGPNEACDHFENLISKVSFEVDVAAVEIGLQS